MGCGSQNVKMDNCKVGFIYQNILLRRSLGGSEVNESWVMVQFLCHLYLFKSHYFNVQLIRVIYLIILGNLISNFV